MLVTIVFWRIVIGIVVVKMLGFIVIIFISLVLVIVVIVVKVRLDETAEMFRITI